MEILPLFSPSDFPNKEDEPQLGGTVKATRRKFKVKAELTVERYNQSDKVRPPETEGIVAILRNNNIRVSAEELEDIEASYSGKKITEDKCGKPVVINGKRYVSVGFGPHRGEVRHELFELVGPAEFTDKTWTYAEVTANPDMADKFRKRSEGFYHGCQVKWRRDWILQGPPLYAKEKKA